MTCKLSQETIEKIISFHGHSCPGLSIGIRASELAQQELGDLPDTRMVCIVETDMCGVDAVQFLTGCTFGKGNLIHKDYGKMAFTFSIEKQGRVSVVCSNPGHGVIWPRRYLHYTAKSLPARLVKQNKRDVKNSGSK